MSMTIILAIAVGGGAFTAAVGVWVTYQVLALRRARLRLQADRQREADLEALARDLRVVVGEQPRITGHIDAEFEDEDRVWSCADCKFFELEAAQTAMKNNGAFARVMSVLSPYENGKRVVTKEIDCPTCMPGSVPGEGDPCITCGGQRTIAKTVAEYPAAFPMNALWSEFGWCTNPNVNFEGTRFNERIIWGGSSEKLMLCEGRLFQLRKKQRPTLRSVG